MDAKKTDRPAKPPRPLMVGIASTASVELPGFRERFSHGLRYLVAGEGEPLVLVHGLGGAASNWLAPPPLLRGRLRPPADRRTPRSVRRCDRVVPGDGSPTRCLTRRPRAIT